MDIVTIKDLGESYLANESVSVPKDINNKDYNKIQKWIADGGTISVDTTEEKKTKLRNHLIQVRKEYIISNDWYAARFVKRSKDVPQEIIDKENQAAQEIDDIEAATTLTELNKFNKTFE